MLGFLKSRAFRIYIIPGAVFQSVMVGGGYGTGREIVEYFTAYGSLGGLLGIVVSYLLLATILILTFEFARKFKAFDYRHFFKGLLGRAWVSFEILIILQFLLVLAVLASAAGNILNDTLNLPYIAGLLLMLMAVGALTFFGQSLISKVLTAWSFLLYLVFAVFLIAVLRDDGVSFGSSGQLREWSINDGWLTSGFKYALYNLAVLPLLLYTARDFETRTETIRSGAIAGGIALLPAVFFHVALIHTGPTVLEQAIPAYWVMSQMGLTGLIVVYTAMLFGTFIETGAGMLQGINDRIDGYLLEINRKPLTRAWRASIAMLAILVSAGLSLLGITQLIAHGYGTMAWLFLLVYVLPLLTIGVSKLRRDP